ncbi:hypothetical protein OUZ56_032610, partial [Daphnia magna]
MPAIGRLRQPVVATAAPLNFIDDRRCCVGASRGEAPSGEHHGARYATCSNAPPQRTPCGATGAGRTSLHG